MNVKLIRMWSGEDVLADIVAEEEDFITITNPIVAVPAGQGQVGFAPWSPLLPSKGMEIKVVKTYIVFITETQEQMVNNYRDMFSVIQTPGDKKLII